MPRRTLVAFISMVAWPVAAAAATRVVHAFPEPPSLPSYGSLLVGTDGFLYGTTIDGGFRDRGTVFKVRQDGTGFTILHAFSGDDGYAPYAGLADVDGVLYGTTVWGGITGTGDGVIFSLRENGTGFSKLHDFTFFDGFMPFATPVVVGGRLYGGTIGGGASGKGTLFSINLDGTGFQTIHEFAGVDGSSVVGLVGSGDVIYGASGAPGFGTIFKVNTDGTGFVTLHAFAASVGYANPGLTLSNGVLFGTAQDGQFDPGTIFRLNVDGSDFVILHQFDYLTGSQPYGGVVDIDGVLYGTTSNGGGGTSVFLTHGFGVVYSILEDGSAYTVLHDFNIPPIDGGTPQAGFTRVGGFLYGTTPGNTLYRIAPDGTGYTTVCHIDLNREGSNPGPLVAGVDGTLFGTAQGGELGNGFVFGVGADGSGFTRRHEFDTPDGLVVSSPLSVSEGSLFGTLEGTDSTNAGVVFSFDPTGAGYTPLHVFTNTDGALPLGPLAVSDDAVYGTTSAGGADGVGVVYRLGKDGGGFLQLHDFATTDGATPVAGVVDLGGMLYGTTSSGGAHGDGVIFRVSEDGSGFTTLHDFAGGAGDGNGSQAALLVSGGTLYGTTAAGGAIDKGTVFRINPDGTGFVVLHEFDGMSGAAPKAALVEFGGLLYGVASAGGALGSGTAFRLAKDGAGFTKLHDFDGASGTTPTGLVVSGDGLYGTTSSGGPGGAGLVYRLLLTPTVTTPTASSVTTTSAMLGGTVASDGGDVVTERGVVYAPASSEPDPVIGAVGVTRLVADETDPFSVVGSDLLPATQYAFKAYAINGVGTSYSSRVTFRTANTQLVGLTQPFYVGETARPSVSVSVTRTGQITDAASVSYATSDGTAMAGVDYKATSGILSFAPGAATTSLSIALVPSNAYRGDRFFLVRLSNPQPQGAGLDTYAVTAVTIHDSHPASAIEFSAATYAATEGGSPAIVTVRRSAPANRPVSVTYATVDGTATAPADYTTTSGILSFGPGVVSRTFAVPITDDQTPEPAKAFGLVLSNPAGGVLGSRATAQVAIKDNEPSVQFAAASFAASEASRKAVITVKRTGGAGGTITVAYATGTGTATAGSDYVATSGVLTFKPGVASQTLSVSIVDDKLDEGTETVPLTLSNANPPAALGALSSATLSILDNESVVQFGAASYSGTERSGDLAGRSVVTVRRLGGVTGTSHVDYATSAGTAQPGIDYSDVSGRLTFGPGIASQTFAVPVLSNTVDETSPTVNLTLTAVDVPLGTPSTAVLTLTDDDTAGAAQFAGSAFAGSASAGTVTITVTRNGTAGPASVQYATNDGTAVAGTDYSSTNGVLIFGPGETTKQFEVPIAVTGSPNKSFFVSLGASTGNLAVGSVGRATVWILE